MVFINFDTGSRIVLSTLTSEYRHSWTVAWGYLPGLTSNGGKKKCCKNEVKLISELLKYMFWSFMNSAPVPLWSDLVFSPPPWPVAGLCLYAGFLVISPDPPWSAETDWPEVKPKENSSNDQQVVLRIWGCFCSFYLNLTLFLCLLLLLLLLHTSPSEPMSWTPYCPIRGMRNASIRCRKIWMCVQWKELIL